MPPWVGKVTPSFPSRLRSRMIYLWKKILISIHSSPLIPIPPKCQQFRTPVWYFNFHPHNNNKKNLSPLPKMLRKCDRTINTPRHLPLANGRKARSSPIRWKHPKLKTYFMRSFMSGPRLPLAPVSLAVRWYARFCGAFFF